MKPINVGLLGIGTVGGGTMGGAARATARRSRAAPAARSVISVVARQGRRQGEEARRWRRIESPRTRSRWCAIPTSTS